MLFIQVIHNQLDQTVVKLVCRFEKLDFKHWETANMQTCKNWFPLEKIRIKKKNITTLVRELAIAKEELLDTLNFLIVSSKEKSILKLRHLIPGYKPETSLDSHDPVKVISNFSSHAL